MNRILLVDDDPLVAEGLALGISSPGRTILVCQDIPSAEIVLTGEPVDAVIADVQYHGDFSFDGLDFVSRVGSELPESRIIVMSGSGANGLSQEAIRRGAYAFLSKPFELRALEALLPNRATDEDRNERIVRVPNLDQLISEQLIGSHVQPIVELGSRKTIGFEFLARIDSDSDLGNPENLFRYAASLGRTCDAEISCIASSFTGAAALLDSNYRFFLNLHPSSLEEPRLATALIDEADRNGVPLDRVVAEITEQASLRLNRCLPQIERLRERGVTFAFDDVGVAFSHLPHIAEVRPEWMKISQEFGTGFENDPVKSRIVDNVRDLAESFECNLILEGIEVEETAEEAVARRIRYGQGYFFHRPAAPEEFTT